ncbi:methionyl-tRNA formyltransferase [Ammonicoccus fulvus]|uniref:Methionyl-tRNA formyltransferase n=1 Tax=Ammonicoccus fulvus TaxID=3138240 RepID=A0ABZ3FNB2_9ACTN
MRLVFAGTPEVALPALDALAESDHELVAVVTRPDAAVGRSKKLIPTPVAQRAEELGIEVLRPGHPRDPEFVARLTELAPDCCPVVAYGAILPAHVLEIPTHGWVNLHFSLLPRWRGAAPVQRAIMAGDAETGACVFDIVPELDAGDVYAELRTPIEPTDTAGDLLDRLAQSGGALLARVMDDLEAGTAVGTPQPEDGVTIAPKLTVAEAEVDWSADDAEIDRRIRGCTPAPGAWTTFRGERFKIHAAHPVGGARLDPGAIATSKQWLQVGTGSRPLELDLVQPFGKKAMRAADWARGVTFEAGERFGA